MSDLNKNTHNQITEQDIKEHRSRGIYLRDDHCDWGSSGIEEISAEDSISQTFISSYIGRIKCQQRATYHLN